MLILKVKCAQNLLFIYLFPTFDQIEDFCFNQRTKKGFTITIEISKLVASKTDIRKLIKVFQVREISKNSKTKFVYISFKLNLKLFYLKQLYLTFYTS